MQSTWHLYDNVLLPEKKKTFGGGVEKQVEKRLFVRENQKNLWDKEVEKSAKTRAITISRRKIGSIV